MSRTRLNQHKQQGKKLLPPFAQMPQMQNASWMNERLPQMLWAAVIIGNLDRDHALNIFRRVVNHVGAQGDKSLGDVRLTGIAKLPAAQRTSLLQVLVSEEPVRRVLSSLLLFEALPARNEWETAIEIGPRPESVEFLMRGVARTLWHQSQEATDCRWVRLLCVAMAGTCIMPPETLQELVNYPEQGDMRRVRPTIRAGEISLSSIGDEPVATEWVNAFWKEALVNSPCFPLLRETQESQQNACTTLTRIDEVYRYVIEHAAKTRCSSAIDAKHDAAFGFAFYSLSIIRELMNVGNAKSIIGRLGLRALLEAFITFAYLVRKKIQSSGVRIVCMELAKQNLVR